MEFSLITQTFETLRIPPPSKLILLEAQTLSSAHVPPYPPDISTLLTDIDSREIALHLKDVLLTTYPPDHLIQWVCEGNTKEEKLIEISGEECSENTCMY